MGLWYGDLYRFPDCIAVGVAGRTRGLKVWVNVHVLLKSLRRNKRGVKASTWMLAFFQSSNSDRNEEGNKTV